MKMKNVIASALAVICGLFAGCGKPDGGKPGEPASNPKYADVNYVDNSDTKAPKEFKDFSISSFKVSFYDEGGKTYSSSMDDVPAPELPYEGSYSYELTVTREKNARSGRLSSSFCKEIEVTGDLVRKLETLAKENDIGSLNGLDIRGEGLPKYAPCYTLEITLDSGEVIKSTANGSKVPENWNKFQYDMHRLLFFTFMDAGYETSGGFHSTEPMKRIGTGYMADKILLNVEKIVEETDKPKSYDYKLDVSYFKFNDFQNNYPKLMVTLNSLSDKYKDLARKSLEEDYEVMESADSKQKKTKDKIFGYTLYAIDSLDFDGDLVNFKLVEGHMNTLGLGYCGYGLYKNYEFLIDIKSGEILTAADLFTSPEAMEEYVIPRFMDRRTDLDKTKLSEALKTPVPEGAGITYCDRYFTIWLPYDLSADGTIPYSLDIYYDEVQDIISDKYTEVRKDNSVTY